MPQTNFRQLTDYAKNLSSLTPDKEACLIEIGEWLKPQLGRVTDAFYDVLQQIPEARPLLEGRVDSLKQTHRLWLESLLTGPFDESFTKAMYRVGEIHVKVKLPVEFMAGGTTLINSQLIHMVGECHGNNQKTCQEALGALNSVLGFCLIVMQKSYQSSLLMEEFEGFLNITGISKTLYKNLASAHSGKTKEASS